MQYYTVDLIDVITAPEKIILMLAWRLNYGGAVINYGIFSLQVQLLILF